MSFDARPWQSGQLLVAHEHRVLHGAGDGAQAHPQHDAHARRAQVQASAPRSNAPGKSSPMVVVVGPRYTGVAASPNSESRWRQPPQGGQTSRRSATTATAVIAVSPA